MKLFFCSAFFLLVGVISFCQTPAFQVSSLSLNEPKGSDTIIYTPTKTALTLIILTEDSAYGYPDTSLYSGALYHSFTTITHCLKVAKKKWGDSLVVILKTIESASYKATVNALDIMTIEKIKKYTMVELTPNEKAFVYSGILFSPPPTPILTPSKSKTVTKDINDHAFAFYITLKNDSTTLYKTDSTLNDRNYREAKSDQLEKAIAAFKQQCKLEGNQELVFIIGTRDTKYPQFKDAIDALKKNDLFKYHLITTPDN